MDSISSMFRYLEVMNLESTGRRSKVLTCSCLSTGLARVIDIDLVSCNLPLVEDTGLSMQLGVHRTRTRSI